MHCRSRAVIECGHGFVRTALELQDVKDSHQEAANAAPLAVKLCKMVSTSMPLHAADIMPKQAWHALHKLLNSVSKVKLAAPAAGWAGPLPHPLQSQRPGVATLTHGSCAKQPLVHRECLQIAESEDWESEIDDIVHRFEQETGRHPFYTICWY